MRKALFRAGANAAVHGPDRRDSACDHESKALHGLHQAAVEGEKAQLTFDRASQHALRFPGRRQVDCIVGAQRESLGQTAGIPQHLFAELVPL